MNRQQITTKLTELSYLDYICLLISKLTGFNLTFESPDKLEIAASSLYNASFLYC